MKIFDGQRRSVNCRVGPLTPIRSFEQLSPKQSRSAVHCMGMGTASDVWVPLARSPESDPASSSSASSSSFSSESSASTLFFLPPGPLRAFSRFLRAISAACRRAERRTYTSQTVARAHTQAQAFAQFEYCTVVSDTVFAN